MLSTALDRCICSFSAVDGRASQITSLVHGFDTEHAGKFAARQDLAPTISTKLPRWHFSLSYPGGEETHMKYSKTSSISVCIIANPFCMKAFHPLPFRGEVAVVCRRKAAKEERYSHFFMMTIGKAAEPPQDLSSCWSEYRWKEKSETCTKPLLWSALVLALFCQTYSQSSLQCAHG